MRSYMTASAIVDLGAQACCNIRYIYVKGVLPAVKRMEEDPASIRERALVSVRNAVENARRGVEWRS
jgi:hypothetical protein